MARTQSIGRQVELIIKDINGIGLSKLTSRIEGGQRSLESGHLVSPYTHSAKSLENVRNELTSLGRYAKEHFGVKEMREIDKEIVSHWIKDKGDISARTASGYLSNVNKVGETHLNVSRADIKEIRQEIKELRDPDYSSRYYDKTEQITLPDRSQPAYELQRDYGLRVSAACHIDVEKNLSHDNVLHYHEKGGRDGFKELTPELAQAIRDQAVDGKYDINNRTFSRDLQKAIEQKGNDWNGTHGMRHTYAQNKLEEGWTKAEVSASMGHTREEITDTYTR